MHTSLVHALLAILLLLGPAGNSYMVSAAFAASPAHGSPALRGPQCAPQSPATARHDTATLPRWVQRRPSTPFITNFGTATGVDGTIYIVGGDYGPCSGGTSRALLGFNLTRNTVRTLHPMPFAIDAPLAATTSDGRLYVIVPGGSTVLAYTPAANTWTTAASLPTGFIARAITGNSDTDLYAIGVTGGSTSAMYVYTPWRNAWQPLAGPPDAANGRLLVSSGGLVYALGSQLAVYGAQSDTWTTLPAPPAQDSFYQAVVARNGYIYALGYDTSYNCVGAAYDPTTAAWITTAAPSQLVSGLAMGNDGRLAQFDGVDSVGQPNPFLATYGPLVQPRPAAVHVGATITLNGSDFSASGTVQIYWGTPLTGTLVATGATNATGVLTPVHFGLPRSATSGQRAIISVVDTSSTYEVNTVVTIL